MKNKEQVENWIYGRGYHEIQWQQPFVYFSLEQTTDDFILPNLMMQNKETPYKYDQYYIARGQMTSVNTTNRWWALYGAIGYINLFEQQLGLHKPAFLTDADKRLYLAHAKFLKA